jgi:hypothetical protein
VKHCYVNVIKPYWGFCPLLPRQAHGDEFANFIVRPRKWTAIFFFCVLISYFTFILFCLFPESVDLVSFPTFILFLFSFLLVLPLRFLFFSHFLICFFCLQVQVLHFIPFIQIFPFSFFFRHTLFILLFPFLLHILYCIVVLLASHIRSMCKQILLSQKCMSANFDGLTRFQPLSNTKELCMDVRLATAWTAGRILLCLGSFHRGKAAGARSWLLTII